MKRIYQLYCDANNMTTIMAALTSYASIYKKAKFEPQFKEVRDLVIKLNRQCGIKDEDAKEVFEMTLEMLK